MYILLILSLNGYLFLVFVVCIMLIFVLLYVVNDNVLLVISFMLLVFDVFLEVVEICLLMLVVGMISLVMEIL